MRCTIGELMLSCSISNCWNCVRVPMTRPFDPFVGTPPPAPRLRSSGGQAVNHREEDYKANPMFVQAIDSQNFIYILSLKGQGVAVDACWDVDGLYQHAEHMTIQWGTERHPVMCHHKKINSTLLHAWPPMQWPVCGTCFGRWTTRRGDGSRGLEGAAGARRLTGVGHGAPLVRCGLVTVARRALRARPSTNGRAAAPEGLPTSRCTSGIAPAADAERFRVTFSGPLAGSPHAHHHPRASV